MAEVSRALGARATLTAETPAPLSPVQRVRVLGVAADSRSGVAVLSVDGAASRLFKVGEEVLPGIQIQELDRLGVVIRTVASGKLDRIDLPVPSGSIPGKLSDLRNSPPSTGANPAPLDAVAPVPVLAPNTIAAPAPGMVTSLPGVSVSR
jgi:hypothetical protein